MGHDSWAPEVARPIAGEHNFAEIEGDMVMPRIWQGIVQRIRSWRRRPDHPEVSLSATDRGVDLQAFVSKVIEDIVQGAGDAQQALGRAVEVQKRDEGAIAFDLSVTVERSSSSATGVEINVSVPIGLQGDINLGLVQRHLAVQRVSFSVSVASYTLEEEARRRAALSRPSGTY